MVPRDEDLDRVTDVQGAGRFHGEQSPAGRHITGERSEVAPRGFVEDLAQTLDREAGSGATVGAEFLDEF